MTYEILRPTLWFTTGEFVHERKLYFYFTDEAISQLKKYGYLKEASPKKGKKCIVYGMEVGTILTFDPMSNSATVTTGLNAGVRTVTFGDGAELTSDRADDYNLYG